ncbi:MAG: TonB-dependent receptor [Gemmatimonadales bacterium]|nr:TonB-dependent receptor [Gemmatimonadales bacterium]
MHPSLRATLAPSVLFCLASALNAQTTAADSARQRLDSVVVTATRESRSLSETPFAVSVVAPSQWGSRSGFGLDQALGQVPGVFVQSRYGSSDIRLTIRGYGARGAGDRSNAGTSRGVRILLDGIPETEPDGRTAFDHVDLATIERVEVLRSNGSAAWGNAAGGIVSLSTMPDFARDFSEVAQQSGSFGLRRTIARVGFGIGNAKTWLSMTRTTFDGWREHSDASRTQLVGGAVAPVGERGRLGVQLAAASNLFRIPGPLTPAQYAADPQEANPTYLARDERRFNRLMRLGVTLERPIGASQDVSAMLFINPKYLQRSERNTFRDFTRYHVGGSGSWGVRFTAASAEHRLRAGGDFAFQDGSIQFYDLTPEGTRGTTLRTNKGEGAQNAGAFVQDEIALSDRLTLVLGARYDDLAYFYRDFITPSIDASRRFQRVTPRGGVSWRVGRGTSLYASYGGGVEIPAGNETDPPTTGLPGPATAISPLIDPIRSSTIEGGVRRHSVFSGGLLRTLSLDAAVYRTIVNGEPVPYSSGRFYLTAGEVERMGLELGVSSALAGGFSARLTGTFSDNTYERYRIDSTYLGAPGASAVLDGNAVVGLPGLVMNGSIGWRPPAAQWLSLEVGAQGNDSYWADDRNAVRVPGNTVWRASVAAERTSVRGLTTRFVVSGENLLDRRYVGSAFINPDYVGGAPLAYEAGLPRALLVSLSFRRSR